MSATNNVLLSGFMSVHRRPLQIQIKSRIMRSATMYTYTPPPSTLNLKYCTPSKKMRLKHKSLLTMCAIHHPLYNYNEDDPADLVHRDIDIQPTTQYCYKNPPSCPIWVYMDALKKPAIALATMLLLLWLLLLMPHRPAWAASGGRMGGWSSSSPCSSSSSWSSSSSPSVDVDDDDDDDDSSSPWSSSSQSYPSSTALPSSPSSSSPSSPLSNMIVMLSNIILMALFLYVLGICGLVHEHEDDLEFVSATLKNDIRMMLSLMLMVIMLPIKLALPGVGLEKTSVLQLQVGLLGLAKSLQRELNQIAETCHTSTPEDLYHVLTKTTHALLRHPDYCISAYSISDVKTSIEEGQMRFNQLSIEERAKFDEETLVNVNNIRRQRPTSPGGDDGFNNEYIVVTILVAAQGDHTNLPTINESKDLKDVLEKLSSIPSRQIRGVEVLWTPQAENDTLSEKELYEDYPLLRPI